MIRLTVGVFVTYQCIDMQYPNRFFLCIGLYRNQNSMVRHTLVSPRMKCKCIRGRTAVCSRQDLISVN